MKTILFFFTAFFLLTATSLFAQANADTTLANEYFAKGETYLKKANYDSSTVFFEKARAIYQKRNLWEDDIICVNKIARNHIQLGNFGEALSILNDGLRIGQHKLDTNHIELSGIYNNFGMIYREKREFENSLHNYNKALQIRISILGYFHPLVATTLNGLGNLYITQGEFDSALTYMNRTLDIRSKVHSPGHIDISKSYYGIGNIYFLLGEYDLALNYYFKSFDLMQKTLSETHPDIAKGYQNIGNVYYLKGDYEKAIEFNFKALNLRKNIVGLQNSDIAWNYNNLGLIYNEIGDYNKALEYYYLAVNCNQNIMGPEHVLASIYNNIGLTYDDKKDYIKALLNHKKSLELKLKNKKPNLLEISGSYTNIALIYTSMGIYDSALYFLTKSLEIDIEKLGINHHYIAKVYNAFGDVYYHKADFKKAFEYRQAALNIKLRTFGNKHSEVAKCYRWIGQVYQAAAKPDSALLYYQKSLIAICEGFNDTSYYNNPLLTMKISLPIEMLKILKSKASCFEDNYLTGSSTGKDLEASINTSELAVQLIDKIRSGYQSESSKLFLGEQSYEIFETGVRSASMMYQITNDIKYKKLSFWFAEKSKAGVLLESLNDTKAKSYAGIPDSVLNVEKSLRNELIAYDKHLTEELGKGKEANQQRLSTLQNKVFELKRKYEDHVKLLEQNYPSYFSLKYQSNISSVDDIQKNLPDKSTAVIEYFLTKDSLYIYSITKKQFDMSIVPKDSMFDSKIKLIRNILSKGKSSDWRIYGETSNELYHLLIKPLPLLSNVSQLVIVPDGILNLIPFESLVTEPIKDKERGYENLSYLIQKFAISYSYSATLYDESLLKSASKAKNEYVGFAPVFSKESNAGTVTKSHAIFLSDSAGTQRGLVDRNSIVAIPGTKDEILSVYDGYNKKEKKATVYTFLQANENNLKKEKLSEYKYIHFATHGFVNEEQPALSGIILAQDTSITEDGVLYAGEVYGLQLDAESVILSACETGLGKQVRGEGIIGLTRGFLYAGARSVVVSLWQVADESTSKLMQDMFKRLSEDKNSYNHRSKLLRDTKLKMIKDKHYAAPFYWSPFILIGK